MNGVFLPAIRENARFDDLFNDERMLLEISALGDYESWEISTHPDGSIIREVTNKRFLPVITNNNLFLSTLFSSLDQPVSSPPSFAQNNIVIDCPPAQEPSLSGVITNMTCMTEHALDGALFERSRATWRSSWAR